MKIEATGYLLWSYFLFIFVCLQFFRAFFPINFSSGLDQNTSEGFNELQDIPHFERSILMIIDALRYDFVEQMPFTKRLVNEENACLVKLKVHPPTVTMPKIKTIVSGSVPSFIDVVLNLNNGQAMTSDNLLHQMKKNNKSIVFYGDNVWTKMFPAKNFFTRKGENVDSFFVNDFYGGDNNISLAIHKELNTSDWDLMILHYLGLDHIGHVLGALNPTIDAKLREMDGIVNEIYENFIKDYSENVIFITGDHGMRDAGGHGGSSQDEIQVPLIVLGVNCDKVTENYDQTDLATTAAVLLGLNIPETSNGAVIPELLSHLSDEEKLLVLNQTSQRLLEKISSQFGYEITTNREFFFQLNEARNAHNEYLTTKNPVPFMTAALKYASASQEMRSLLTANTVKYDMSSILVSTFAAFTITLKIIAVIFGHVTHIEFKSSPKAILKQFFLIIFSCILSKSITTDLSWMDFSCVVITIWISASNLLYITQRNNLHAMLKVYQNFQNLTLLQLVLVVLYAFHAISLVSSSYVEEEHQTWYFFFNTFCVVLFLTDVKSTFTTQIRPQWRTKLLEWMIFFGTHIFARRLNQTGDKWINVPDVGDFLVMPENKFLLTIFVIFGEILLFRSVFSEAWSKWTSISVGGCLVAIFAYRASSGVLLPNIDQRHSDACLAAFWIGIGLILLSTVTNKEISKMKIFVVTIVLVSALIHKPHNIILNAILVITSRFVTYKIKETMFSKEPDSSLMIILIHFCMGKVFYFYQGNSNSLATIDLTAGYVGLHHFSFAAVGVLLTLNTFNGQILSFLLLIKNSMKKSSGKENTKKFSCDMLLKTYIVLTTTPICFYLVVMILFRYHLFIWTVFSPKLLYKFYVMLLNFVMTSSVFVLNKV
ncbi:GPI ethanolamine phosphate transferase 2 [Culicoides brevitarsis]|uniref:GPI ethanolamine phosphate transferase 2 n=1 Tax=Culicoides brevitarsis TaxID=469753 RepID=UPI00307B107E